MKLLLNCEECHKTCCFIKFNLGDVILQSRYFISWYYLAIHRYYTISSSIKSVSEALNNERLWGWSKLQIKFNLFSSPIIVWSNTSSSTSSSITKYGKITINYLLLWVSCQRKCSSSGKCFFLCHGFTNKLSLNQLNFFLQWEYLITCCH